MNTNWGLLLGLVFSVIVTSILMAFFINWAYYRYTMPSEISAADGWSVKHWDEKRMSLPRPATAPTAALATVPETPVTGTAIPFHFSKPISAALARMSFGNRLSQYTIDEHTAAGAIQSPERTHRRSRSGYWRAYDKPRAMHSRNHSRQMHSRGQSIREYMHSRNESKHSRNRAVDLEANNFF